MAEGPEKDTKTEPATPRRRREARKNGQVAMSTELIAALMLIAGFGALVFTGGTIGTTGGELVTDIIRQLGALSADDLDVQGATVLVKGVFIGALTPLLVVLIPGLLTGILIGYGQVGFMITPKAV